MVKKKFRVDGMTCNSCTRLIESSLRPFVRSVSASYSKGLVTVDFDPDKVSLDDLSSMIEKEGYTVVEGASSNGSFSDRLGLYVLCGSLLLLAFVVYQWVVGLNIALPGIGESTSLILLFLVGLLTGFHCVSMCGGFIIAYMTKNAHNGHVGFSQHVVYGGAKTLSYIVLGGLFGLIGGVVSFSVGLRGGVAVFAGLFMVFYAFSMLGVKFFRRFQVNPKWLSRFTARASHNARGPFKAPLVTGLLSGLFIACGPLQAMYLYAAGTGSVVSGSLSLAAFGLGTLPILLGFGGIASSLSHSTMRKFLKVSAVIVLILGLVMLNRGLTVLGSPYTFDSFSSSVIGGGSGVGVSVVEGDVQVISMVVDRYGWSPDTFTLKRGVPVRWEIDVRELTGCNNEILVSEYGLDVKLREGLNVVEFTPSVSKTVRWSCWMGMIPGSFIVTDDGVASSSELERASVISSSGGSCGVGGSGGCGCGGVR